MYQVKIVLNILNKRSGTTVNKKSKGLRKSHFNDLEMSYHS